MFFTNKECCERCPNCISSFGGTSNSSIGIRQMGPHDPHQRTRDHGPIDPTFELVSWTEFIGLYQIFNIFWVTSNRAHHRTVVYMGGCVSHSHMKMVGQENHGCCLFACEVKKENGRPLVKEGNRTSPEPRGLTSVVEPTVYRKSPFLLACSCVNIIHFLVAR